MRKGDQFALVFIPEAQLEAGEALPQRQASYRFEFGVIFQHFGQAVIGNAAVEVVHMMDADIAGEPGQRARQIVKRAAKQGGFGQLPFLMTGPVGVLEPVLAGISNFLPAARADIPP